MQFQMDQKCMIVHDITRFQEFLLSYPAIFDIFPSICLPCQTKIRYLCNPWFCDQNISCSKVAVNKLEIEKKKKMAAANFGSKYSNLLKFKTGESENNRSTVLGSLLP